MAFYKSNFRKKVITVSSVGVTGIGIATTAGILISYKDQIWSNEQSDQVDVPKDENVLPPSSNTGPSVPGTNGGNLNDDVVEEKQEEEVERVGTMSAAVLSEIRGIVLEFKDAEANNLKNSNNQKMRQSYSEFETNGDFSNYQANWDALQKDLYLYVNDIWTANGKNVDFTSVNIKNNNLSSNFQLGKSTISFEIEISIEAFKLAIFQIGNNSYKLSEGKHTLTIKAENQALTPDINFSSNTYYLGWKLPNVSVQMNNEKAFDTEFSPSSSYSYAFQYVFTDLVNKQNYVEFYKANQQKILDLDVAQAKTKIQDYYLQQYSNDLDFIDYGIKILDSIRSNPDVKSLLAKVVPYVTKMAVQLDILPSFLEPILSKGFATDESLLKVFSENKDDVYIYLEDNLWDLSEILIPLINEIKPGISTDKLNDIKGLLMYLNVDNSIIDIIINDFLGGNGTEPKSIYNIVVDNIDTILNLAMGSSAESSVVTGLSNLIKQFTTVGPNKQLTKVFNVIFENKTTKKNFIESLGKMFNLSAVTNILDIMFTNNDLINVTNIQNILHSIYDFTNGIFERKANYEDFRTGYKNLTFTTWFTKVPSVDKSKQTIDFEYRISFNINKKVTLNLKPIKNLFDGNKVWDLINSFYDLSGIGWAVNKDWLYQGVTGFIPNSISVGGTYASMTQTTYTANNSSVYVDGIRSGTDYKLGFKFNYTTTVAFKDQTLVSSITNDYKRGSDWYQIAPIIAWGDYYYSDFWRGILKNIITRDYTFSFRANVQYSDDTVATTETYDPNLYITGFTIASKNTKLTDKQVYDKVKTYKESELYKSRDERYDIKWSNTDNYSEVLKSLTPTVPKALTDYIAASNYSTTQNDEYIKGTNFAITSHSDVLFNFSLPINIVVKYLVGKTNVNIKLDVFAMRFQMFLPFMFYDTQTNKMIDSVSDSYSSFNMEAGTTMSWFWEAAFWQ